MLRPGRFARPAPVRTFTLELSLPLSPSGASSTTTRVHSQFPWLDFHQLDTQHYGLPTKRTQSRRKRKREAQGPVSVNGVDGEGNTCGAQGVAYRAATVTERRS